MGMGDDPRPYQPKHRLVRCARCGHQWARQTVTRCRHPAVMEHYGGEVYICMYCCRRKPCPEHAVDAWHHDYCKLREQDGKD